MRSEAEKAEWRARMAGFVKEVASWSLEERTAKAARMPVMTPEGHALSMTNTALLLLQRGGALTTIVGGFRQWIRNGRHVRKGEHACGFIRVPIGQGKQQDGTASAPANDNPIFFRWVPVFDVVQTDEGQGSKVEAAELAEATA